MIARAPVTDRSSSTMRMLLGKCAFTWLFIYWQVDPNSSSFAESALNANLTRVFFYNFFGVRHAETQSAGLIGIEGFKNLLDSIFSHSRSGIFDFQRKHLSGAGARDAQSAASRHRLNCIQQQVQQGCANT